MEYVEIEPIVIFGHSFVGQLAALVAEGMGAHALQPIFINPALGTPWDLKPVTIHRRYAPGPEPATFPVAPSHHGAAAESRHGKHSRPPDVTRYPANRCPGRLGPIHPGR